MDPSLDTEIQNTEHGVERKEQGNAKKIYCLLGFQGDVVDRLPPWGCCTAITAVRYYEMMT